MKKSVYTEHLLENEEVHFETEQHLFTRLSLHILLFIGILAATVFLDNTLRGTFDIHPTPTWIFFLIIGPSGTYILYVIIWQLLLTRRGLVFTNQRILFFHNDIFSHSVRVIPYEYIIEYQLAENFISNYFGYATLRLQMFEGKEELFRSYIDLYQCEPILNEHVLHKKNMGAMKTHVEYEE